MARKRSEEEQSDEEVLANTEQRHHIITELLKAQGMSHRVLETVEKSVDRDVARDALAELGFSERGVEYVLDLRMAQFSQLSRQALVEEDGSLKEQIAALKKKLAL